MPNDTNHKLTSGSLFPPVPKHLLLLPGNEMREGYEKPIDMRVTVIEEAILRIDQRLDAIGGRTYELITSHNELSHDNDEVKEHNRTLFARISEIQHALNELQIANAQHDTRMELHTKLCTLRAARFEKLGWVMVTALIGIIAFLLQQFFTKIVRI